MPSPVPTIDVDLEEVRRALAAVEPQSERPLLFGFRARG
jgi:hypothetical protein